MKKSSFKLPASEVERMKSMVPNIAELRIIDLMRDYRGIRKAYFGKSIPPVEDVLLRFMSSREISRISGVRDTIAFCMCGETYGHVLPTTILIDEESDIEEIRRSLRHEMAHLKVNLKFGRSMGEGRNWKREIRRLVCAGAYDGLL
jgi:hypothetical protein